MGKVTIEYPDIQLDPSYFLTPEAAAMYGLGPEVTPNDVLLHIPGYVAARMFHGWVNIFAYWTPGPFTWTAPDLFWGTPYRVGVLVVGAGGSGAALTNTSIYKGASGGASGYIETDIIWVTPGQTYSGVVGLQGAPVTAVGDSNGSVMEGNNGGSSSFNGLVAKGGGGGHINASGALYSNGAEGAQCSSVVMCNCNPFGGTIVPLRETTSSSYRDYVSGKPVACYDPFRCKSILATGSRRMGGQ